MLKWLWQLKWALVIAIVAGPVFSYFSYNDGKRIERILAQGAAFTAHVDSVQEVPHRRGGPTYTLRAVWSGAGGTQYDHNFDITSRFAGEIIRGDSITISDVTVKYLEGEVEGTVLVEDAANKLSDDQFNFWFGIIAGIAGLIFSPIIFFVERRQAKAQNEDIDATLARMRAGNTQA